MPFQISSIWKMLNLSLIHIKLGLSFGEGGPLLSETYCLWDSTCPNLSCSIFFRAHAYYRLMDANHNFPAMSVLVNGPVVVMTISKCEELQ